MEVKTYILRRLPVLVYNPQSAKVADGTQDDPKITSIYFDNDKFSLYTGKIDRTPNASSVRLRWYGKLKDKPEIFLEQKTTLEGDHTEENRISIKEKYIQPFLTGQYKMEKSVQKMQDQHRKREGVDQYQQKVDDLQRFVLENELQPMLRAHYKRTAFQIPGDDRIRVSLDTDLVCIREDSLDPEHPSRQPHDWHRTDIDGVGMEYPFKRIAKAEKSEFPFALLEFRFRSGGRRQMPEWVADLTSSHLVQETARFSKFVHGVAVLFEDQVNSLPFWISDLDKDIRKDPATAFEEEQERAAIRAEEELVVGSFLGDAASPARTGPASGGIRRALGPSQTESRPALVAQAKSDAPAVVEHRKHGSAAGETAVGAVRPEQQAAEGRWSNIRFLLPTFATSRFARARNYGTLQLPPGIEPPGQLLKDSGPLRIEPKVWLANERTFLRWQNVSILLGSLALALYNAAVSNDLARTLAFVYASLAVFAMAWGWTMYIRRSKMIAQRSGKDFDNVVGPIVLCLGLLAAIVVNFVLQVRTSDLSFLSSSSLRVAIS